MHSHKNESGSVTDPWTDEIEVRSGHGMLTMFSDECRSKFQRLSEQAGNSTVPYGVEMVVYQECRSHVAVEFRGVTG